MSVKTGLARLKQQREEAAAREAARNRPKANWLGTGMINKAGGSITGRFLQELDEDSPSFNPERGTAVLAVEHEAPGPDGFKRRGLCTADPDDGGDCYPCQRHQADPTAGWKQKENFYINFLAEDGKTYVISRNANSSFVGALMEEAVDEETEEPISITDSDFKITVSGSGTQTQWLIKRLKRAPLDDSKAEVFDLEETALRRVPYADQPKFYGGVFKETTADEPDADAGASTDADW